MAMGSLGREPSGLAPDGRLPLYPADIDVENQNQYERADEILKQNEDVFLPMYYPSEDNVLVGPNETESESCEESNGKGSETSSVPDDGLEGEEEPEGLLSSLGDGVPEYKPLPFDADTNLHRWMCIGMTLGRGGRSLLTMMARSKGARPIAEKVHAAILANRTQVCIKELIGKSVDMPAKTFTIRIEMLEATIDIHRVVSGVPANFPLRAFQDRVLCTIFDWARGVKNNMKDYAFYLPATAYPRGRRPLEKSKDIAFMPIQKPEIFVGAADSFITDAQPVDDSRVCLADLLQQVGHHIYYKHNKIGPLHFKIMLQKVEEADGTTHPKLLSGYGLNPPEDLLTEVAGYTDDGEEVWGA